MKWFVRLLLSVLLLVTGGSVELYASSSNSKSNTILTKGTFGNELTKADALKHLLDLRIDTGHNAHKKAGKKLCTTVNESEDEEVSLKKDNNAGACIVAFFILQCLNNNFLQQINKCLTQIRHIYYSSLQKHIVLRVIRI